MGGQLGQAQAVDPHVARQRGFFGLNLRMQLGDELHGGERAVEVARAQRAERQVELHQRPHSVAGLGAHALNRTSGWPAVTG